MANTDITADAATESESDTQRSWSIGDAVTDRDDDTTDAAIVVNTPSVSADEWNIPRINKTAAEDNPAYPADAAVVVVVFEEIVDEWLPDWGREKPLSLSTLNGNSIPHYSFPAPRLEAARVEPDIESESSGESESETQESKPNTDTETETETETEIPGATEPDTETESEAVETTASAASDMPGETGTSEAETGTGTESDLDPEPSAAVRALAERLAEGGMTTEIEADGQTIRAGKLGETYRLQLGEVIEGDGALRGRLEEIAAETEQQATN
jgi:hypothetical protein